MSTGLTLAIIPARGGSKGVPGKNLRPFQGEPLLVHSIYCGLTSPSVDRVVVSTDSPEIAKIAKSSGAEVPFMRPSHLATDTSPMMPVLEHAVSACEVEYGLPVNLVVLLHPTSPLRTPQDVESCISIINEGGCDAVISCRPARRSPHFNMVVEEEGYARLAMLPKDPIGRRQDAPDVYDLDTSVWVYTRRAITQQSRLPPQTKLYVIPEERSSDLDTELDFQVLECLLATRKGT